MRTPMWSVLPTALLAIGFLAVGSFVGAQQPNLRLKIEDLMTPKELKETGVSGLSEPQRIALDAWLNRYTEKIINALKENAKNECTPVVESTIAGDFSGWDGETIFKLDNGQIWEQAEYDYSYSYAYRPDVTIYPTSAGCRMRVEGEDETILVRRIQ